MKSYKYFFIVLLLFNNLTTAQWYQQNSGTTIDLYSVFFINENTGWTCGDSGKIIKTTNGGLDWLEQNSNTTIWLKGIQFVDANNGWAYGYNQILNTTDGGTVWNVQDFPPPAYIVALQYINLNIGWIIYHNSDSSFIAKTTNGGNTWEVQNQAQNEYYGAMYFLDENYGWMAIAFPTSGILKTINGGINWTQYNANFAGDITCLKFVDQLTGWISNNTLGSYDISKSTDGGETWFSQIAQGLNNFVYSINFQSTSIGYATGWQMFMPPNPEEGFILKTADGGSNWFEQYRDNGALYSIFFVNDTSGWVVGNGGIILHTTNGGVPVELISFTAEALDGKINLSWTTATELNNLGFEVERKTESELWQTIGFVRGNGTTTEIQNYSFIDDLFGVTESRLSYRLKQIDFNGTYDYSEEIEILRAPATFSLEQNYPNPFNPTTSIQYAIGSRQFVTLKVYDILGNEIATLS